MKIKLENVFLNGKEYLKFSKAVADLGLERRTALKRAKKQGIKLYRIVGQGETNYITRSDFERYTKTIIVEQNLEDTKY